MPGEVNAGGWRKAIISMIRSPWIPAAVHYAWEGGGAATSECLIRRRLVDCFNGEI